MIPCFVVVCVFTSKRAQQDFLIEGHGSLTAAAHHVSDRLIDGKPGERIRHLRERERERDSLALHVYFISFSVKTDPKQ